MSGKRVLLINPPQTQPKESVKRCIVPYGLATIATYLENRGHKVTIFDCIVEDYTNEVYHEDGQMTFGSSDGAIKDVLCAEDPQYVGVSSMMSSEFHNAQRVCELVKEVNKKTQVIIGGAHASAYPKLTLKDKYVDHLVYGEGEVSTAKIVEGEARGFVQSPLLEADKIPWPARHLILMEKYLRIDMPTSVFGKGSRTTQIETSRGCPFKCCFCCTTNFWGRRWRARSPEDVGKEVKHLVEQYNVDELDVLDSNLVVDKKRTSALCKEIKPFGIYWANPGGIWAGGLDKPLLKEMKESGCYQVTFAVENANPKILYDVIHKPTKLEPIKDLVDYCHKIGMDTHAFLVMGFPEESVQSMKDTYKWALKMNFHSATFNIIQPLPGSEIWEQCYKGKLDNLKDINLRKSTIKHPDITRNDLEVMVDKFNSKFNSSAWRRHPKLFFKKYVRVALKRRDMKFIKRMFKRQ